VKSSNLNTNNYLGIIAATVFSFLFAMPFSNYASDKIENDWTRDKLNGEVKSYTREVFNHNTYFIIFTKRQLLADRKTIKVFDKKGNILELKSYQPFLDEHGYERIGRIIDNQIYRYDENGYKVEWRNYNTDKSSSYDLETYEYNDKGLLIVLNKFRYIDFIIKDSLILESSSVVTYKYDEKGNNVEKIETYPNGAVQIDSFTYDSIGNMIGWNTFGNGKKINTRIYKYDNNGNEIESYPYDISRAKTLSKYDDRGYKIKLQRISVKGRVGFEEAYKYDEKGNIIRKKTNHFKNENYSDPKYKIRYKYKYDAMGNWIKQSTFSGGRLLRIIERSFDYY